MILSQYTSGKRQFYLRVDAKTSCQGMLFFVQSYKTYQALNVTSVFKLNIYLLFFVIFSLCFKDLNSKGGEFKIFFSLHLLNNTYIFENNDNYFYANPFKYLESVTMESESESR